jgi:hypothetical protein
MGSLTLFTADAAVGSVSDGRKARHWSAPKIWITTGLGVANS